MSVYNSVNRFGNVTVVYHRRVQKDRYFECFFSFCNRPQAYLLVFFEPSDWYAISLAQNFVLLARNSWLRKEKCFPNLKERDISTVSNTANLSTLRHLTNHSMIPESGIMGRLHQRHVSRLRRAFPSPVHPWACFAHRYFLLFHPVCWLLRPLRSLLPG